MAGKIELGNVTRQFRSRNMEELTGKSQEPIVPARKFKGPLKESFGIKLRKKFLKSISQKYGYIEFWAELDVKSQKEEPEIDMNMYLNKSAGGLNKIKFDRIAKEWEVRFYPLDQQTLADIWQMYTSASAGAAMQTSNRNEYANYASYGDYEIWW